MELDQVVEKRINIAIIVTFLILLPCFLFDDQDDIIRLYSFACSYIILQYIRDFMFTIPWKHWLGYSFIGAHSLVVFLLIAVDQSFISQIFLLVLIGEIVFTYSLRLSLAFSILAYIGFIMGKWIAFDFPGWETMSFMIPRVTEFIVVIGFSYLVKRTMQQKIQLEKAFERIKKSSLQLEEKTIIQERKRIAGEMHDVTGYTFSSAIIGMEAIKQMIDNDPHAAKQWTTNIRSQLQQGLEQIRFSVRQLQESHFFIDFPTAMMTLIDDTEQQTGIQVTSQMDIDKSSCSSNQEITLYRALQEGLTNGLRHGRANWFQFTLTTKDQMIYFYLADNGTGVRSANFQKGFGLSAMEERINVLGGRLNIYTKPTGHAGFAYEIYLPSESLHKEEVG
ncbi:two-component sensor histidine kinase [Gracilibacillus halophilus YIM-C55.5]|uniref:histidine kinase n=1 Tax=Gracilibacillus halophilus YIM-C55.5 TaxID=1308866 RepID=N4WAR2_9BACI|nr:sensor histidine kinase [Gracilibacillus halophilus]ENH96354.1 two-component sensor histidine kinase [Gracilibacillus halophilus YIM-C55.5]